MSFRRANIAIVIILLSIRYSFGQPQLPANCYTNADRTCANVLNSLIFDDNQPLKVRCSACLPDPDPNHPGQFVCPDMGGRGIFPDPDTSIEWIVYHPTAPNGNQTGKKSYTENAETVCGTIKSCNGCETVGGQQRCKSESIGVEWKVKPRRISGEECKYEEN